MTTTPAIDLATLLKDVPPGAWVAISSNYKRVVAYDFDMQSVIAQANKKGEREPLITRVPESNTTLTL